jgi:acetyl-CoA synthase
MGIPDNFYDMIADETVGITEEEILPFLQEKAIRPCPWIR